jgi:hypothetical protein
MLIPSAGRYTAWVAAGTKGYKARMGSQWAINAAELAIDGNKNQDWVGNSCASTGDPSSSGYSWDWLAVDMGAAQVVTGVTLWARSDAPWVASGC